MTHEPTVDCPACGGPGMVSDDEYDRIVLALELLDTVPANRLRSWHTVTLKEESWHIAHPITCDLDSCPFDAEAQDWDEPPDEPGVYRWFRPDGALEAQ